MKKTFVFTIILSFFMQFAFAQYQNHSGLRNKQLRMISVDSRDIFNKIQGDLPSDEKLPDWNPKGVVSIQKSTIDSVVVLDDAPLKLIVLVYFNNITKATIQASASSNKNRILPSINSANQVVANGQSPVELTLTANLPENTEIISRQITITLSDPQRLSPDKIYGFTLNKRWNSTIKAENLTQKIILEPIGTANTLWQMPNVLASASTKNYKTPQSNDKTPKGASKQAFSLWDRIKTDIDFELNELSNIKAEIHPDANLASETFYISPVSYNLKWTKEEGFKNFKIIYGANGEVQFHSILETGISTKQLDAIRHLIKKYYKFQNIDIQNPKLVLLGANSSPIVSLKSDFQGVFQIDPSKITLTAPSDFLSPLKLSWTTDNKTKDMIVAAMQNGFGLNGAMSFGTDSISKQIPLSVAFNDRRTYGKIIFSNQNWRKNDWQNTFPFPVKVRNLHALISSETETHIYSWSCQNTIVPQNSRLLFDASKVPEWLDNSDKLVQLWLEYDIEKCSDCTQNLIKSLTSGLSGSSETSLSIQSMDLIESLEASLIQIRVRSIQADPSGNKEVELNTTLSKDGESVSLGPFYTQNDKKLNYQYKILVINKQAPIETNWIGDTNPQLFLNKAMLEKLIGKSLK